jgi:NADPH:quinone reductase-like Zn-dependent oxidoreductase
MDSPNGTSEGSRLRYRRVIVTRLGGPEVLQMIEEDLPQPKHGEARVRILAAGVAYPDLLMREGPRLVAHPSHRAGM